MPWLESVAVSRHFKAPDFQVDLSPDEGAEFKHLILTGPNGSGKTTILQKLTSAVSQWMNEGLQRENMPFRVEVGWTAPGVNHDWRNNCFVGISLALHTPFAVNPVDGPIRLEPFNAAPAQPRAQQFLQYLVNQQVQARLAREDDPAASDAIFA